MKTITFLIYTTIFCTILFGCKKAVIEGKVIDCFNKPIGNVNVNVFGTQFNTVTDKEGKYSIKYVPGEIKVIFQKTGYNDTSFTVKISAESEFPAQNVLMYDIPGAAGNSGYYYIKESKYESLNEMKLSKSKDTYNSGDWFNSTYKMTKFFIHGAENEKITKIKLRTSNLYDFISKSEKPYALFLLSIEEYYMEGKAGTLNVLLKRVERFIEGKDNYSLVKGENVKLNNKCFLNKYTLSPHSIYAFVEFDYNKRGEFDLNKPFNNTFYLDIYPFQVIE